MQLSSKRAVTIMTALASLDLMIGTGQLKVTAHMIPEAYIPAVQDWASFLAVLLTTAAAVITGGSWATDTSAPAVPAAPKAAAGLALCVGLGLVLAMFGSGPANAKQKFPLVFKSPAQLNQSIDADIKAKIAQFEQVTIADLTAAKQIFDAAKNTNGAACAAAWLALAQANATIDAAALPDPHVFSFLAKAYNLHVALQPNASLRTACAAMKDDLNGGLLGIGGGAAAVTKLVPALAMFGL